MSLKITNKLTAKQRELLLKLEYVGKWDLTIEQAAEVIDELIMDKFEANQDLTFGDFSNKFGLD